MNSLEKQTASVYLWTQFLNTPIWVLFNILQYIIYKDLHATPLQITIVVTLKPLVSLFSIYWGAAVDKRPDRLLSNVIWARILSLLPFFFFPFMENIWFFIASFAFYMMLARGTVPAWMEILKCNTPKASHAKLFATGSFISHLGNCIFPFLIGFILDGYFQSWRWLFPATALLSLSTILLQRNISIQSTISPKSSLPPKKNFLQTVTHPWKNAWQLMQKRPDFRKFQIGFMLGGAGMMIAHPALPIYFVDVLNLSYTEMSLAINCFKGLGFILTTPFWARLLNKTNIFHFSSLPILWTCAFSICILLAPYNIFYLFLGYFCYGITQAGSDLLWHLSGTIFAKNEDSPRFSNVNILTVGIRGCAIPPLGSLLCSGINAPFVIAIGGFLCFFCNRYLSYYNTAMYRTSNEQPNS